MLKKHAQHTPSEGTIFGELIFLDASSLNIEMGGGGARAVLLMRQIDAAP